MLSSLRRIILVVAATAAGLWPNFLFSADELKVHFVDVGTGDCIWIQTPNDGVAGNRQKEGYNIFIDGGDIGTFGRIDAYTIIADYLFQGDIERLPLGSTIDCIILTHPHSDHLGGLLGLLKDYQVKRILDPGYDKTDDEGEPDREDPRSAYGKFFAAASTEMWTDLSGAEHKAEYVWGIPAGMHTLDWGKELNVEILHSSTKILDADLNNVSIVLRITYGDKSFLFTGDAEGYVEKKLIESHGSQLRSTVLKVGHHGSDSSSTVDFVRLVKPAYAIISSGNQKFNGVQLPKDGTFQRLKTGAPDVKILRTDREDDKSRQVGTEGGDDTIIATTDGLSLQVQYLSDDANLNVPVGTGLRCATTTTKGTRCKRMVTDGQDRCWQHR